MRILHSTLYALSGLAVLVLTSCGKSGAPAAAPAGAPVIEVSAIIATPDTFLYSSEASGSVIANEFVELKSEVSGRIVQLNIQEGNMVAEGTLLAKVNDEDLQATLRKYQSQLDIAVKNRDRLKSLLDLKGLNQADYDAAVNTVNTINADIDFTKAQIRKTEIRAPFSGLVGLRNVSPGAIITPSQVLATLQQTSALKVDFVLPEGQSSDVKNGSVVKVNDDNHQSYNARVIAVEPQISAGTRNVKFRAIIEGSTGQLHPGAFVSVDVEKGNNALSILVPTNAIIPESRNKKVALIKNGKVKFQIVETGYRGEEKVQVLSGLQQGDTIAVSGLLFLKPDAPVKIRSIQ